MSTSASIELIASVIGIFTFVTGFTTVQQLLEDPPPKPPSGETSGGSNNPTGKESGGSAGARPKQATKPRARAAPAGCSITLGLQARLLSEPDIFASRLSVIRANEQVLPVLEIADASSSGPRIPMYKVQHADKVGWISNQEITDVAAKCQQG